MMCFLNNRSPENEGGKKMCDRNQSQNISKFGEIILSTFIYPKNAYYFLNIWFRDSYNLEKLSVHDN